MSPISGTILLEEIAPRLRSVIPRSVKKVGAEDDEELIQDGLCMAARLLQGVEAAGKHVTAGNIAYYTILHMKSGRRSSGCGRTDALASATQLDGKSSVLSMEDEVGYDPELDEPITLGELLADEREDPAMAGGRNVDWDEFLRSHDYRYGIIVAAIIEGQNLSETARATGLNYYLLTQLKQKLVDDLVAFMGAQAVADSTRVPAWRAHIVKDRERVACRADRRRQ